MSISHPVVNAMACDAYQCGHISRSSSTPVKRALFLHLAEVADLGSLVRRDEDPATLAALALMREGATCADVIAAATDRPAMEAMLADLGTPDLGSLSPQVLAVMALVTEGLSYPEIAAQVGSATETVRSHVKRAMRATGEHTAVDAAVVLVAEGLI